MNNLKRYMNFLFKWVLAAALIIPATGWGHGMLDFPEARQGICARVGGVWGPEDGSGISDPGCKKAALIWTAPGDRAYPLSHWHEFAANVAGHRDLENVKRAIPDGTLCSGNDSRKKGFDLAMPEWQKTKVDVVNGKMTVRLSGTQPHVPGYIRVFLTRPGYHATAPLKWADLVLLHTEELSSYRTDWNNSVAPKPSYVPAVIGFFQFDVNVPNGQSGDAILYLIWQREDQGNEGFYNCADITLGGGSIPAPWTAKGQFIAPDIAPKVGETVRVRVFGDGKVGKDGKGFSEIVDESIAVSANNQLPAQWGAEMVQALAKHASIIKVGVLSGSDVVFNPNNMSQNQFYVANKDHTVQMSVISDENPGPVNPNPPRADIQGPTTVRAGQTFTLDGSHSVTYNPSKPLAFQWVSSFSEEKGSSPTHSFTAPAVGSEPKQYWVELHVADAVNDTVGKARHNITVTPSGGGDLPQYVPGTAYKAGDQVSNNGSNYECLPWPVTGWCALPAYEPGNANGNWVNAWKKL